MVLEKYRKKRDFARTPEPKGKRSRASKKLHFVVQKHDASRLHYDFRLELGGVLKSWAVPKGPSLDPAQKRLAVEVEDHPMDYASFEGTIPKGQYGGGTVLVWDRGAWTPEEDPVRGLAKGSLKFSLEGEKLRGSWTLVRMRGRGPKEDRNWLLIKHADDEARPEKKFDVIRASPESVLTGRGLPEISTAGDRVWKSKETRAAAKTRKSSRGAPRRVSGRRSRPEAATIDGARRAPMPEGIEPELATLVQRAPQGDDWIHESKFDGYRALCRIERGRATWWTRNGNDWTQKFKSLSPAVEAMSVDSALLDGEVVVLRPDGTTSFQDLQNAFRDGTKEFTYCAFDLLFLDGYDLRTAPLLARKEALRECLRSVGELPTLRYSEHVEGRGEEVFRAACPHGLEGIVSKRRDAPYRSGRGPDWVKTKCSLQQEFVVGGFTPPGGAREKFGALLLGTYDGKELHYAGRVGTGFDRKTLGAVRAKLRELETKDAPFSDPPSGVAARDVTWVKPKLVAAIQFTGWTSDGRLRHPSFQGLREDKPASEVVREIPKTTPRARPAKTKPSSNGDAEVDGVRILHPERVVYPTQGITKVEVARYYSAMGRWQLPQIAGRPLNTLRCPQGSGKPCFFQRHAHGTFPEFVESIDVGPGEMAMVVESVAGIVALVQMGVLEIHPWEARVDRLEQPDRIFFDLDPDPSVPWKRVVDTAHLLRGMLEKLDLESYVKTTGGKGLHVVVPIARRQGWDQVKAFARGIAEQMARSAPDLYVSVASKARRTGKIFIDYLRNARSASSVAAYSTRAREGATVSMPLEWNEIARAHNEDFDLRKALAWVKKRKRDPWATMTKSEQTLSATALRSAQTRVSVRA